MPDGGTLSIATSRPIRGGPGVSIRVRDTGAGVPAELLPRLFEPFSKGATSRGSGLGLASVRAICDQHGGTIDVETSAGAGTTFTLTFPLSRS